MAATDVTILLQAGVGGVIMASFISEVKFFCYFSLG